jgi:hypothetical protein
MKLVIAMVVLFAAVVSAQMTGTGIGLILGEPTGVSLKSWLSGNSALTVGAAWSFQHEGNLFLWADYTLHSFNITNDEDFRSLAFYYGIGGKLSFVEKRELDGDEAVIGARVPLGLTMPIGDAPVDLFVEAVPTMDLIPETEFGFNGGIGAHLFF